MNSDGEKSWQLVGGLHHKYRTVIESKEFKEDKINIEPDARRFDEAIEGVVWVLSLTPTLGTRIPDTDIWFVPTGNWGSTPLTFYYTFGEDEVVLISVEKVPQEELSD